jgi:hypothetical protein
MIGFQWIVTGRFSQSRATVVKRERKGWLVRYDPIWPDPTAEPTYAHFSKDELEVKRVS